MCRRACKSLERIADCLSFFFCERNSGLAYAVIFTKGSHPNHPISMLEEHITETGFAFTLFIISVHPKDDIHSGISMRSASSYLRGVVIKEAIIY